MPGIVGLTVDHAGLVSLHTYFGICRVEPVSFLVNPSSIEVLCCAEKLCASSCRRGSNLSHRFSAQQSTDQGPVVKKDPFQYGPKNSPFRENSPFSLT